MIWLEDCFERDVCYINNCRLVMYRDWFVFFEVSFVVVDIILVLGNGYIMFLGRGSILFVCIKC